MDSLDPNIAVPAIATLLGVLAASFLAFLGTRGRKAPPAPLEPVKVPPSPLAAFSGTQNEFMALIIQDNENFRREIAELKEGLARLSHDLASAIAEHGAFELAVRRYLELLAGSWPGPEPMPWPETETDIGILERTLPRRRR